MPMIETAHQSFRILDHLPLGAVVLRQDLVVMFWNTCLEAWTGKTRQCLLDTPIDRTFPRFKHPYYVNRLKQVFEAGMPSIFSAQLHDPLLPLLPSPAETRQQHITVTPVQLDCSPERYALLTIQDVTDLANSLHECQLMRQQALAAQQSQERLEAQLSQNHKLAAIGTLAGGIAHDFNNMLAVILGFTELAMHDTPQENASQHYLQAVLTAGQRARELVQQILTFCHQQQPQRQSIQLQMLVQETLQLLRASLPATIDIQTDIDATAAPIMADPSQMHQVLVNLCTNAGHAMRAHGGTLMVSLCAMEVEAPLSTAAQTPLRPGPYIRLAVKDTGHGIAPEMRPHIFEPFFTTKETGEGTGMGLAMVQSIVANHGGSVTVDSEPGHGTTFTVCLPCSQAAVGVAHGCEEAIPTGHHERILFVDDETVLTHLGEAMLERLGYETVVQSSSQEALEMFRAAPQHFDLVITDQTMPHMTGEGLIREIRSIRPDIPVILCTGFSRTMTPEKARALGIDALMYKPLVSRDLALAIQRVLACRLAA